MVAPTVVKVCPSIVFYSDLGGVEWDGTTWEDLTVHVKQLQEHISLLNSDRQEINAYCNSN